MSDDLSRCKQGTIAGREETETTWPKHNVGDIRFLCWPTYWLTDHDHIVLPHELSWLHHRWRACFLCQKHRLRSACNDSNEACQVVLQILFQLSTPTLAFSRHQFNYSYILPCEDASSRASIMYHVCKVISFHHSRQTPTFIIFKVDCQLELGSNSSTHIAWPDKFPTQKKCGIKQKKEYHQLLIDELKLETHLVTRFMLQKKYSKCNPATVPFLRARTQVHCTLL